MIGYGKKIYDARYFWTHLAKAELKYKFRRSKLGILWTFLTPLLLTVLMTVVFGTVFNTSYTQYAPYILSGLIVWDLITGSVIAGGGAILVADPYIRQFNHPITIYPLKSAIVTTISFLIAMCALVIWMIFTNSLYVVIGILSLPITSMLYFMLSWGLTIIASFTNTKFRDYPQVMALVMQAVWYVSPVFLRGEMFNTNEYLQVFFNLNPVTHILNLVRTPFLEGKFPPTSTYVYVLVMIVLIWIMAVFKVKKDEREIIYYL